MITVNKNSLEDAGIPLATTSFGIIAKNTAKNPASHISTKKPPNVKGQIKVSVHNKSIS